MKFELINPSDKYVFEAPSLEVAAVATAVLGRGMYGARQIDGGGDGEVPIFFVSDPNPWFEERFGRSLDKSLHLVDRQQLCACLRSVEIPGPGEHDAKRTSMNDIRAKAQAIADALDAQEVREDVS